MGVLGKILIIIACAIGIVCTLAAIITYRDRIDSDNKTGNEKASIACMFIAFFIFAGIAILIFITLCCPCSDLVVGVVAAVAGVAALAFSIGSYVAYSKPLIDLHRILPLVSEWLFGGIVSGAGLLLVALTLAVS
ncbi:hypothetical protein PHET_00595 [Paragonimus heterotremus]|uniref:Uncharacterized protein n=1 Tax=Paragonimus heterotremus TaxID=100268 RepID=A0A8J4TSJ9_9TREM|nr:hypothetical protein PHET_00595 [Paragonimus heterotremus]